jgi:Spy/CpxP family protein refolding chaperone
MKIKIVLISLALAGTALFATAQAKAHFGGHRGPFGRALNQLELSPEQQGQLDALRTKHRQEREARRQEGERPTREERQEHFAAVRAEFEAILTPDQLATLTELKEQRGERGERGRRGGRGQRGRHGFGQLDLSDTQQEQLKTLRQEQREQMQARRESGERPSPEEIEAHRAESRAKLAKILTSDQLATLDEIHEKRGERGFRGKHGTRGGHGHRNPLGGALRQLDLSDEQKEQLKTIRQEHRKQMQAQRQSGERPTAAQRQEHREQARAQIETILSPEQLEKLEELLPVTQQSSAATLQAPAAGQNGATSVESQSWGAVKKETGKNR